MREIEFRAWDTIGKRMITTRQSVATIVTRYLRDFATGTATGGFYDPESLRDKYIILQFTGLKDKNGKEICEGDILGGDFNRVYSEVFFNEKRAQFMARSHISTGSLTKIDHVEVIGNIYENPELLK